MPYLDKTAAVAALCAVFLGAPSAHATVISYFYTGLPIDVCNWGGCPYEGQEAITGEFTLDERLVPGGTIRNVTMSFYSNPYDPKGYNSWEVRTPSTTYSGHLEHSVGWTTGVYPDYSVVGVLSYTYEFFYSYIGYFSELGITFDNERNIIDWSGGSMEGGSFDRGSGTSFDEDGNGWRSEGPGVWTKTILQESPAPIPLGGALGYALFGLASLAGVSFRRRMAQPV